MIKNNLIENQDYMSAYVPAEPAYIHQEYPKWVHVDGSSRIVNSAEEEAALVGTPEDASVENELDTLIAKAEDLGITIDKRWGVKRLREEIERVSR